jgi:hypothetical protein
VRRATRSLPGGDDSPRRATRKSRAPVPGPDRRGADRAVRNVHGGCEPGDAFLRHVSESRPRLPGGGMKRQGDLRPSGSPEVHRFRAGCRGVAAQCRFFSSPSSRASSPFVTPLGPSPQRRPSKLACGGVWKSSRRIRVGRKASSAMPGSSSRSTVEERRCAEDAHDVDCVARDSFTLLMRAQRVRFPPSYSLSL